MSFGPPLDTTAPASVRVKRITAFIPLVWTGIAILAQLVLTIGMVPRLPSSVELTVVGKVSSGPGHYLVSIGNLVTIMWAIIMVCAILSLLFAVQVAAKRLPREIVALAALVACAISTTLGLVFANLIPQLGALATPETESSAEFFGAALGLVVGLALGLLSILALPPKLALLGHRSRQEG